MDNIIPEIIFSSSDSYTSRRLSELRKEGKIRQLIKNVYTSNLEDKDENIIRRNRLLLLSNRFPGAIISHRSAIEFQPTENGNLYLTYNTRKVIRWPGLTLRIAPGGVPLNDDNPIFENLFISSLERACLENLTPTRTVDGEKKTLSQEKIENRLMQLLQVSGEEGLNKFRDRAREISKEIGMEKEFQKLNKILSSILSTRPSKILKSPVATAHALGEPYDAGRMELFEKLIAGLRNHDFPIYQSKANDTNAFRTISFYESYFSNYIEGTKFEVEEAEGIIFSGIQIENRSGDSHDILGTFEICSNKNEMSKIPNTGEKLLEILRQRHRIILRGRPDKNPGIFKSKSNRAGSTIFVDPNKVAGTLKHGFKLIQSLASPIARAFYMMFLISEVHPFDDGNGRIARIMMNAELVNQGYSKMIVPTVYREDYILNIKKLTRTWEPNGYIKMLNRAYAFSHWLEPSEPSKIREQLVQSNAFEDSDVAVLRF